MLIRRTRCAPPARLTVTAAPLISCPVTLQFVPSVSSIRAAAGPASVACPDAFAFRERDAQFGCIRSVIRFEEFGLTFLLKRNIPYPLALAREEYLPGII